MSASAAVFSGCPKGIHLGAADSLFFYGLQRISDDHAPSRPIPRLGDLRTELKCYSDVLVSRDMPRWIVVEMKPAPQILFGLPVIPTSAHFRADRTVVSQGLCTYKNRDWSILSFVIVLMEVRS